MTHRGALVPTGEQRCKCRTIPMRTTRQDANVVMQGCTVCGSHLLKASVSWAIRKVRSLSVWPSTVMVTGALKLRSSDGTGCADTPDSTNVLVSSSASSTALLSSPCLANLPSWTVNGSSAPSGPSRPIQMGMSTGTLSGWPLVGGVTWRVVMVHVWADASYPVITVNCGVPAWLYHRLRAERSALLALAMASRKSSHVTAQPSWRLK